jgi:hypothetical protein
VARAARQWLPSRMLANRRARPHQSSDFSGQQMQRQLDRACEATVRAPCHHCAFLRLRPGPRSSLLRPRQPTIAVASGAALSGACMRRD